MVLKGMKYVAKLKLKNVSDQLKKVQNLVGLLRCVFTAYGLEKNFIPDNNFSSNNNVLLLGTHKIKNNVTLHFVSKKNQLKNLDLGVWQIILIVSDKRKTARAVIDIKNFLWCVCGFG